MPELIGVNEDRKLAQAFPGVELLKLTEAIMQAVARSFQEQVVISRTHSEIKRRVTICTDWALVMRCELGWSYLRVYDHLHQALKSELNGKKWEPPAGTTYLRRP